MFRQHTTRRDTPSDGHMKLRSRLSSNWLKTCEKWFAFTAFWRNESTVCNVSERCHYGMRARTFAFGERQQDEARVGQGLTFKALHWCSMAKRTSPSEPQERPYKTTGVLRPADLWELLNRVA